MKTFSKGHTFNDILFLVQPIGMFAVIDYIFIVDKEYSIKTKLIKYL